MRSRWGRIAAGVYLGMATIAGTVAALRLVESSEMPGLAAWELVAMALPWSLLLSATARGREAGSLLMAAIVLGGVVLNAVLVYLIAAMLERRRRHA
jgi:hypothetical protein